MIKDLFNEIDFSSMDEYESERIESIACQIDDFMSEVERAFISIKEDLDGVSDCPSAWDTANEWAKELY